MRYVIFEKIAEKDHELAGRTLYYILDTIKNRLSPAYYLTRERAEYWQRLKNEQKCC